MMSLRHALRASTMFAVVATGNVANADPVEITERGDHVTEAEVVVDASAAQIYELITDYSRWPRALSDIQSVIVEEGGRRDARVKFTSRALEHTLTVRFDNVVDREVRFRSDDDRFRGRASGEYLLEPVDGRHTRVRARLYLDVADVQGADANEPLARRMREDKLRADMTDVARSFGEQVARGGVPSRSRELRDLVRGERARVEHGVVECALEVVGRRAHRVAAELEECRVAVDRGRARRDLHAIDVAALRRAVPRHREVVPVAERDRRAAEHVAAAGERVAGELGDERRAHP